MGGQTKAQQRGTSAVCAQLRDMAMGAEGRAPLPVLGKLAEAWAEQVTTETGQPGSAPMAVRLDGAQRYQHPARHPEGA